jgi:hypothetical protein
MFRVGVLGKGAASSFETLVSTKPHSVTSHKTIIFRHPQMIDIRIKYISRTQGNALKIERKRKHDIVGELKEVIKCTESYGTNWNESARKM